MTPPRLRSVDGGDLPDWRNYLILGKPDRHGEASPVRHHVNVTSILRHHPLWAGRIRKNAWDNQIEVHGSLPWRDDNDISRWLDTDTARLQQWIISEVAISIATGADDTERAIQIIADDNAYDPVVNWFESLEWDGRPRLDTFTSVYLGAEQKEYTRQAGRRWFVSAIARALQPGCDAHHMLILEGRQGLGKSRALKIIGGEWFCDTPIEIGNKDAFMAMQGSLILEMAELESIRNAKDLDAVKAFITSPRDTYRQPYARRIVSIPRRCVFAGSVNHAHYFHDPTGNRRFWPVTCTAIDDRALERDRVQLWAEAMAAYRSGEKWHPETDDDAAIFTMEQSERVVIDVWHDDVVAALKQTGDASDDAFYDGPITIPWILGRLGIDKARRGPYEGKRIGSILRSEGYITIREPTTPRRWIWVRPRPPEPGSAG